MKPRFTPRSVAWITNRPRQRSCAGIEGDHGISHPTRIHISIGHHQTEDISRKAVELVQPAETGCAISEGHGPQRNGVWVEELLVGGHGAQGARNRPLRGEMPNGLEPGDRDGGQDTEDGHHDQQLNEAETRYTPEAPPRGGWLRELRCGQL